MASVISGVVNQLRDEVVSVDMNEHTELHNYVKARLYTLGLERSPAICSVISTMLSAPFPMFILVGPERRIIYNAAYEPILGPHHPAAMGQPFFAIWPEVQDVIQPVIDQAAAGEALLFEDMAVILHRPNPEPAWFTFSYSPVRDDTSAIVGVLCVCTETTEAVHSRRRQAFLIDLETSFRGIDDPFLIVEAAQAALGTYLGVSRVGYGTLDASGRYFTTRRNWTDGSVPSHSGTHDLAAFGPEIFSALREGTSLVIAETLTDPRAQEDAVKEAFAALEVRSVITVSLIRNGRFVAALYVHHREPRQWTRQEVDLVHDVAERTWSAVERAYAQADLKALTERQAFLLRLGDELRPLADAKRIKQAAARQLGEFLQVGRAGYGEIDAGQEHVTVECDWTNGTMASLAGETRPLEVFGPAIIEELKAGRTLRLDAVAENPVSAPYAAGYASIGTQALLVVPLLKEGQFVAILYLHEENIRKWTDEEAAIAHDVAERTWSAVERAKAENTLWDLNANLEQRVDEMLEERRFYAGIVEATDSPIQMVGTNYRFLAINPAAQNDYERVFGVRPQVGQSLLDVLAHQPDQQAAAHKVWQRALSGEEFDMSSWWGEGDSRRAYEMRFRPAWDENGRVSGAYLIGRDVTDLLNEQERLAQAEERLRQAQKMEAIGQLTGGVAHDFNNLLTPIVGSLDMLQRKKLGGEREQRMIAGAAQAADRARVLVQRLLAFARRQPLQAAPVDVAELIRGIIELISSTTGPQIRVSTDASDELPPAHADYNQLEMALLNLAVNARDAMPDGGTLRMSAGIKSADGIQPPELAPGTYVCISVSDTGTGMDENTLARAVEPFFSTKGIGKGTGLGLSMVHGLMMQLGGALAIRSQFGLGTNVELWLPISSGSPQGKGDEDAPSPQSVTRSLVLLIDDEDLVRLNTAEMLRSTGYAVIEANSAEEGLQRLETGLLPDLVITDHLMPGMNGTDFARAVRREHPALPVLVVSGYSDVDEVASDLPRLAKPFRNDELLSAIARLTG